MATNHNGKIMNFQNDEKHKNYLVLAANLGLVDTGAGMAMMSIGTLVTYLMEQF